MLFLLFLLLLPHHRHQASVRGESEHAVAVVLVIIDFLFTINPVAGHSPLTEHSKRKTS